MKNSIFTVTVTILCHLAALIFKGRVIVSRLSRYFSHTRTRARMRAPTQKHSINVPTILTYVKNTMTQYDSMTTVEFIRAARCHSDCHGKNQGDTPKTEASWRYQ
jgi:hypothetical protein